MTEAVTGPLEIDFDVTAEVGTGEALKQTAWSFLPSDPSQVKGVLLCLAGGTYDKAYWHLEVPGHPGYSFGLHLASLGFVVVALDHLGVGGSTRAGRELSRTRRPGVADRPLTEETWTCS
jgi:alpha-beta hydrolase superfamily lysophospholipase